MGKLIMTQSEIDIVKQCAAIVAKRYDLHEPWVCPNLILLNFGITPWQLCDDYWYDPETGVNYHF